ncbi:MAG: DNA recombination protein RmuC [Halobacteriovoraceae bacterium]|nr:DNA recombination protein RmuC [Halobacteriovoraceae bacterium]|tara:strand:- start:6096 stop:7115 length:1020 start_codon:yes stop_codon:yes gene_type:complete
MELVLAFVSGLFFALLLGVGLYFFFSRQQLIQFENLSQKILKKSSDEFLTPFDEQLEDYREFIGKVREQDIKERQSVREQISQMLEASQNIQKETHQLTQALSSDVKFQGDWGEMVLERVLELAGLQNEREYYVQKNIEHEGKNYRPDIVVNLPGESFIIIDSKVSLKPYIQYQKEPTGLNLKSLYQSIKSHVDELSKKNYQNLPGVNGPDFVFMFIPVEGVFSLILKEHPEIIDFALKKNIVLVSPLNLLASLKTVGALWRIDKQSKSALDIATKAGAMFDKFCLLKDDLDKVQTQLVRLDSSFQDIHKRLHSGKGNLVDRALELKDHGAKTSRDLSH